MKVSYGVCPHCGASSTWTIDSRWADGRRRRRKGCHDCGRRWTTIELPEAEAEAQMTALAEIDNAIAALQRAHKALRQLEEDPEAVSWDDPTHGL